jgi:CPA2 family monovalent cation:H+ antiporter-2
MVIVGSRVIPGLLHFVARWQSQELFLFTVIAISFGIGALSYWFGLSLSFGAFVAGLVLAGSDYGNKALSEMIPLRDIFALVFFVSIGMMLAPVFILENIGTITLLVFVACAGRGLILAAMCWLFGYRNIIPLAAFLGMMPISEIGFVVVSLGISESAMNAEGVPIINGSEYSMILNMIVLSMLIGPFISVYTGPIYQCFGRISSMFLKKVDTIVLQDTGLNQHVVIIGGRFLARYIARVLNFLQLPYVVIEPNHQLFVNLQRDNLRVIFGDPTQQSILAAAEISKARLMIVTIDSYAEIYGVVRTVKELHPDLRVIVQYEGQDNIKELRQLGINEIVQPEYEVGLEMLRQALASQHVSTQETEHYLDEIRQMLYSPFSSDQSDKQLLRRLRKTMALLELEWIPLTDITPFGGKTVGDLADTINVVGIMRGGVFMANPSPTELFKLGDCVAVVGTTDQINVLVDRLKMETMY